MFLYTIIEAIVGIAAYILLALCTKKSPGVTYGKLDKAGRITNIVLLLVYVVVSPLYLFLGSIASPHYGGFLGIVGWIVSVITASVALVCGVGLGLSVRYRKMGKSKLSFRVQFAGLGAIAVHLAFFFMFYGNLLRPLN